jgi:hypothetical protein
LRDFTVSPTKIHIRKEYYYEVKQKLQDIYISDEAIQYLKQWINWKYNNEARRVGLDERKYGKQRRRKITLHFFRRFVKTVINDQTNTDYSESFLGHNKSPYYTKKEPERREIYASKCMKCLTFLDYTTLEATGKNIEAKLSGKEREVQLLRQRDSMNTDTIANLSD